MKQLFTLLFISASLVSFAQNWQPIATDASGDGIYFDGQNQVAGLDGLSLDYYYDQENDQVVFRFSVSELGSWASSPSADFSFFLPNGLESGAQAGQHWSSGMSPVHKTAFAYADPGGSPPSSYVFGDFPLEIVESYSFMQLCNDCISVELDVANNYMIYTFDRNGIITDAEMDGSSTAQIGLVANVGFEQAWCDNVCGGSVDVGGNGDLATFEINLSTVGVSSEMQEQPFKVYPNPTHSDLFLETNMDFESITIHDFLGKELQRTIQVNNGFIDLPNLSAGVYFLSLISDEGKIVKRERFVVN